MSCGLQQSSCFAKHCKECENLTKSNKQSHFVNILMQLNILVQLEWYQERPKQDSNSDLCDAGAVLYSWVALSRNKKIIRKPFSVLSQEIVML